MMLTPLLVLALAAKAPSVIDAEHDFAELAQKVGQWRSFRETAAPDAVLLIPGPVKAHEWLKGRDEPKVAVRWQPAEAYVSCDGSTAATIGPWQRPNGIGYFVTVWSRVGGKWKWKVDLGDRLEKPMPAPAPMVTSAACSKPRLDKVPKLNAAERSGRGTSADGSLVWSWQSLAKRTRILVLLWNGDSYGVAIDRTVSE